MAPASTSPPPGSMTVPPLFGWEVIATALTILVVVALVFVAVRTTRADRTERSEWQEWLASRSGRGPAPDPE